MVSTHLKNISQNGNLPQVGVKIKNISNHQLVIGWFWWFFTHPSSPLALSKLLATATATPKHAMAAKGSSEDGTLEFLFITLALINPEVHMTLLWVCVYVYIYIFIYIHIPGTCLSSILVVVCPPKQGLFHLKQGSIQWFKDHSVVHLCFPNKCS